MEYRRQPSQGESIFSKLFGKKKNQPPIQVEQKKGPLDELRELQAYKNLKGKFADSGVDYKTGLSKDGLTVGDLVDILSLYLTAAQGSTDGAFRAVANIAEIIPQEGSVDTQTLEEELDKLRRGGRLSGITPEMFDRQNPLYALRPDLTQIIEERLDDLSHYPGGIMLEEIRGKRQEEPKFGLLLTNRQQSDTGKPVKQIFEETGLPVRS